ncbi:hypothetical protein N0V90_006073 [Kalmusia sp. IMI 367209]|nr:hypothetical protein N0V90_006073 [Kalmusia sp. IMI 367209]
MSNTNPPETNTPLAPPASSTMPAPTSASPALSLTLILAATPSLGIGKAGTLPWPQLRKEMGYFKRVTMRVSERSGGIQGARRKVNAVVMGRKTWDSIPERFRPLEGRVNVVITRKPEGFATSKKEEGGNANEGFEGPLAVGSVTEALERLQSFNATSDVNSSAASGTEIDRVFVIGGATIYDAALKLPQTDRVLLTKIDNEFECDTFFSVDLDSNEGWARSGQEAIEEFTGEKIGAMEEKGVKFEFGMYERVRSGR